MAEEVGVSSQARAADEELRLLGTPAVNVADGAPKSARRRRSRGLGAALVGAGALAFAALTGRAVSGSRAIGAALSRLTSITDNGDDAGSWGPADGDDDIALFLNQSMTASNGTADDDEFGASADLDFEVHNDYTELTRKPIGEKYPWLARYKLAEPYRTCKIILTGSLATDESKSLSVMWMINGAKHAGREVQYTFNSTGHFHVLLEATKSKHSHRSSARKVAHEDYVWVRYVRREIRSLSDEDRNRYFGALETIYNTPCNDGKLKYGSAFECIETFTSMHNDLAGDPYCDHAHDGYGFLTMHAALSLWFERGLQAVDGALSLPYWDYTIDMHAVGMAGGDTSKWRDSIVWDDDWFGTSSPSRVDHVIDTGRFAWTPVKVNNANLSMWTNSYGMMRAPWNNNRAHYVTRSNQSYGFTLTDLPGCASHHTVLQYENFSDFGFHILYNPHGTTHLAIGGTWNADWRQKLKEVDYDLQMAPSWTLLGFAKQKNMFRGGDITCPSYCALDVPEVECKCECPGIHGMIHSGKYHTLLDITMENMNAYEYDRYGNDVSEVVYKLLCNYYDDTFAVMGDSLESASPADVSFWPTHPTVDRLFQWRRLNGMPSTYWPDGKAWSVEGSKTGYCQGHDRGDVLPFTELFDAHDGPYSNKELLNLMDPSMSSSPYIYDNFEWPHCLDEGYSIDLMTQNGIPDGNVRAVTLPAPTQKINLAPMPLEKILAGTEEDRAAYEAAEADEIAAQNERIARGGKMR